MSLLAEDTNNLRYRQEDGTVALRAFVEGNIVSKSADVDRLIKYQLYWNFYSGVHWKQYNETFLAFNYSRAFVDKIIAFLVGKTPFSLTVKRYDGLEVDEDQEKQIESFIDYHWNRSNKLALIYEILQMGSVMGDCWLYPEWDPIKRFIRIKLPDSRHCFPKFKDGDINNLESFTVRMPLAKNDKDYKVSCMEFSEKNIVTWKQKDTAVEGKRFEEKSKENPYGFIPIVHIKNRPESTNYYSRSDLTDILKINKVYNELSLEVKAIIDYYGSPTTVITGGTVKSLRKGVGNIWSGLPPEANVFNLGLGEDLSTSLQFLDRLKMSMHEMSDVPETSLGRTQAISNTSAAALQITYQPLIQQANTKWMMYGQGIAEVNAMIISMMRVIDPKNSFWGIFPEQKIEDVFYAEPVFTYGLPQDRTSELTQAQMELTMKIASRKEIMNRLNKSNVPDLLTEIKKDQTELAELMQLGLPADNANNSPQLE